jgi:AraC family transcriptional regulator of arabinose operon
LIRFQTEGSSVVALDGVEQEYHAGDLMIAVPGNDYHLRTGLLTTDKSPRCADYYLSCSLDTGGDGMPDEYPCKLHIGKDDHFLNLCKNIIYEKRKITDSDLQIQDYLTRLLFLSIRRFIHSGTSSYPKAYLPHKMKDYIEQHATEQLTLKQVASNVGLGISRASELFKTTFGRSVIDYVIEVKLNIAREHILYENSSLEEIAYSCGFGSYTHFSRMFSSRFGQSPKEYRQNNTAYMPRKL